MYAVEDVVGAEVTHEVKADGLGWRKLSTWLSVEKQWVELVGWLIVTCLTAQRWTCTDSPGVSRAAVTDELIEELRRGCQQVQWPHEHGGVLSDKCGQCMAAAQTSQ